MRLFKYEPTTRAEKEISVIGICLQLSKLLQCEIVNIRHIHVEMLNLFCFLSYEISVICNERNINCMIQS